MVPRMSWRSKRGGDKAEQTLAAATLARVTDEEGSAEAGIAAVRGVLARVELERSVESIVIVALAEGPLAEVLAAALGDEHSVTVARAADVRVDDVDAAFAVADASQPAREVVDALKPLDAILLGVVVSGAVVAGVAEEAEKPPAEPSSFDAELEQHVAPRPMAPVAEEAAEPPDAALEALAELERAAGSVTQPLEPSPPRREQPAPEPEPIVVAEEPAVETPPDDTELSERLAELTHREAALRKITGAVEQQRARLEEKERDLVEREQALANVVPAQPVDHDRLEEAVARAEQAERRVVELEQRVAELAQRLEAQPVAPAPPPEPSLSPPTVEGPEPPAAAAQHAEPDDGTYNLHRLEQLVRDEQLRDNAEAEEWAYYLPLLREHADSTGRLPAQFHSLIDSVFGV